VKCASNPEVTLDSLLGEGLVKRYPPSEAESCPDSVILSAEDNSLAVRDCNY